MSRDGTKTYRGVIQDRNVVLQEECDLPEGTPVEIRPTDIDRGSPGALLAAVEAPPHVDSADVAELMLAIEAGRRPVRFEPSLD